MNPFLTHLYHIETGLTQIKAKEHLLELRQKLLKHDKNLHALRALLKQVNPPTKAEILRLINTDIL